ncbi:hypothetical protein C8J56DRAFT_970090 [Mycena floridula]|nr:hypothetical protein C8J56DRAFT_970090 [Mycena floridula]
MRYHFVLSCISFLHVLGVLSAPFDAAAPELSRRTGESGSRELWIIAFGGLRPDSWQHRSLYLSPVRPSSGPSRAPGGASASQESPPRSALEFTRMTKADFPRTALDLPRTTSGRTTGFRKPGLIAATLPPGDIWDFKIPADDQGFCCGTKNAEVSHQTNKIPQNFPRYSSETSFAVSRAIVVDINWMTTTAKAVRKEMKSKSDLDNNCQNWIKEMLNRMVKEGKLDRKEAEAALKKAPVMMNKGSKTSRKMKTSSANSCVFM